MEILHFKVISFFTLEEVVIGNQVRTADLFQKLYFIEKGLSVFIILSEGGLFKDFYCEFVIITGNNFINRCKRPFPYFIQVTYDLL